MAFVDRLRTVPVLGTAIRLNEGYQDKSGNQLAGAIAFFGFLSLLPLLLLGLSVTGFVLSADPERSESVIRAIAGAIPGLGDTVRPILDQLIENRGTVGLIGLGGVLLSGLRVIDSAMVATSRVFDRDPTSETGVRLKGRQLGALVLLGFLATLGAAAGATPGVDLQGPASVLLSVGASLLSIGFDVVLFTTAYRILAIGSGPEPGRLWPGALLAAVGWTALKVFGSEYAASQVAKTNALYGAFGSTIGLLLLFYLAARVYLYGAELNVVLAERESDTGPHVDPSAAGELPDVEDLPDAVPSPDPRPAPLRVPPVGADDPSPAVSDATAQRLADADRARAGRPTPVRQAAAFTITVAAIGVLFKVMRPDREP